MKITARIDRDRFRTEPDFGHLVGQVTWTIDGQFTISGGRVFRADPPRHGQRLYVELPAHIEAQDVELYWQFVAAALQAWHDHCQEAGLDPNELPPKRGWKAATQEDVVDYLALNATHLAHPWPAPEPGALTDEQFVAVNAIWLEATNALEHVQQNKEADYRAVFTLSTALAKIADQAKELLDGVALASPKEATLPK